MACALRPTYHFKQRQIERGVTDQEVREAANTRERWRNSEGKFHGRSGVWELVYFERPCNVILITVFSVEE